MIALRACEPASNLRLLPLSRLASTRLSASFLSCRERAALDAVASPSRTVDANTDIIREGERTEFPYVVLKG